MTPIFLNDLIDLMPEIAQAEINMEYGRMDEHENIWASTIAQNSSNHPHFDEKDQLKVILDHLDRSWWIDPLLESDV